MTVARDKVDCKKSEMLKSESLTEDVLLAAFKILGQHFGKDELRKKFEELDTNLETTTKEEEPVTNSEFHYEFSGGAAAGGGRSGKLHSGFRKQVPVRPKPYERASGKMTRNENVFDEERPKKHYSKSRMAGKFRKYNTIM
jgi:hypothetical protein